MLSFTKRLSVWVFAAVLGAAFVPAAGAEVYELDKEHTNIGFAVQHLMLSTTKGEFTDYTGSVTYDPDDLAASSAELEIKAKSIATKNADRDKHLSGPEFLDVDKFPTITFKNAKFVKQSDGVAITGDLTIKDVTKKVTLISKITGPVATPWGFSAIGIDAQGAINRQDFGVSFNKTLDGGGMVVADEVMLQISIEAHKKAEKPEEKQ